MEKKPTVYRFHNGDVFEFQVDGLYYYFQLIRHKDSHKVIKLFFNGVHGRPTDMEGYIQHSPFDYYLHYFDKKEIGRSIFYVGRSKPEYSKWQDETPLYGILALPVDDLRIYKELPYYGVDYNDGWWEIYKNDKRRIVEEWISKASDFNEYFPRWKLKHRLDGEDFGTAIIYNSLPDESLLEFPIYIDAMFCNLSDEVRFFANHGATTRDYFRKRLIDEGSEKTLARVIVAKSASASRMKTSIKETEAFIEKEISSNDKYRTEFSDGDVFEIHRDGYYYYYFQVIRQVLLQNSINIFYCLIKIVYHRFNERQKDLENVVNTYPSQVVLSQALKNEEIELVGNHEVMTEWRDKNPAASIVFYLDQDKSIETEPFSWRVMVFADEPVSKCYSFVHYWSGYRFPAQFRQYPLCYEVGWKGTFSDIAVRDVDYYLANGKFLVDAAGEYWDAERILAWAESIPWTDKQIMEAARKKKGENAPLFVPYKFSATDLRKRVKKLVGMQRRRKLFTSETLANFETILTDFVDNIVGKKDDKKNIRKEVKSAIRKLNRADRKVDHGLIETEEGEELFQFFLDAGSYVGVDIWETIEDERDW